MRLLYLDNPVVRDLTDRPDTWNLLYDDFIENFGRSFQVIQSYYLFFEYIGFTKKELSLPPELIKIIFLEIRSKKITDEMITLIDKELEECVDQIHDYIRNKLYSLREFIEDLIQKRLNRISSFNGAIELEEKLFGNIRALFDQDCDGFVKDASRYLAWDEFCNISPEGFPKDILRQRQIGYWYQLWEEGIILPIGKIIDDVSSYYNMSFKSYFKGSEDMVDAEMLTFLIFGNPTEKGSIERCNCLTYDKGSQVSDRIELALGNIVNIEQSLGVNVQRNSGKVYCLSKDDKEIKIEEFYEPLIPINL